MRIVTFILSAIVCIAVPQDPAASRPAPAASAPASSRAARKNSTFRSVVELRFSIWDRDRDHCLSSDEIDDLVVDPAWRDSDAAALAALKVVVRSGKYTLPPLTLEYLTGAAPEPESRPASEGDEFTETEFSSNISKNESQQKILGKFQSLYVRALGKIHGTPRKLFADPTPDLDRCRQGALGDCFFVASVGALVSRDSGSLLKMIEPSGPGEFTIHFPGKNIQISALTDTEFGLTSTTGDEGLWLPLLEKAFGKLRMEKRPESQRADEFTDAIARGGSLATAIQTLTGGKTVTLGARSAVDPKQKKTKGTPEEESRARSERLESTARRIRTNLQNAMEQKRLAGCSTSSTDSLPPGIQANHAYAILALDAEKDLVTIWNPHGNSFTPRGAPGIANGYITKKGKFQMPVSELVQIFRSVTIEIAPKETKSTAPAREK